MPQANVAMVVQPSGTYVRWDDVEKYLQELALQRLTAEGQWIEQTGELRNALKAVLPYAHSRAEDLWDLSERIKSPPGEAASPEEIKEVYLAWEKANAAVSNAQALLGE
jgi:hypothetical protein